MKASHRIQVVLLRSQGFIEMLVEKNRIQEFV